MATDEEPLTSLPLKTLRLYHCASIYSQLMTPIKLDEEVPIESNITIVNWGLSCHPQTLESAKRKEEGIKTVPKG